MLQYCKKIFEELSSFLLQIYLQLIQDLWSLTVLESENSICSVGRGILLWWFVLLQELSVIQWNSLWWEGNTLQVKYNL